MQKGQKKLKTTDLSEKSFPPNTVVFINEWLCSCHGRNIKCYDPKYP